MDEFRAELDGCREIWFVSRPCASPDAISSLEDEYGQAGFAQRTGRGQPRDAGTYDDNVP